MKGKVKKSIECSIKDGICWSAMVGFVEPYMVPFALGLGASNFFIGVLRSLPVFISSFAQLLSEYLVYYFNSCKRVVFYFVSLQSLSLFFASFCIFFDGWYVKYIFLLFIISYSYSGSTSSAPWYTLMGEYLPEKTRGVFFGKRTQLIGVFYFISSFLAGYMLKEYTGKKFVFFLIFFLAAFFRSCSAYFITFMYEPEKLFHISKEKPSIKKFFDFKIDKNVKKIYKSIFFLLFSTYLAAPYFSVYSLKELKFDYLRYMMITSIGQFLTWISAKYWGKLIDKKGSVYTLSFAFLFIPFISLFWMLTKNFYILMCIEMFSGIIWGAFGMIMNTLVYEYIAPSERTKYTSYLIFVSSISQFLGSIIGGVIYDKVHFSSFSIFVFILAISTLGRFLSLLYFHSKVYRPISPEKFNCCCS